MAYIEVSSVIFKCNVSIQGVTPIFTNGHSASSTDQFEIYNKRFCSQGHDSFMSKMKSPYDQSKIFVTTGYLRVHLSPSKLVNIYALVFLDSVGEP